MEGEGAKQGDEEVPEKVGRLREQEDLAAVQWWSDRGELVASAVERGGSR